MFGFSPWQIVADDGLHFLSSGLAGWLVYWWMLTILPPTLLDYRGKITDSSTARSLFLLSLSAAVLFHIFEDVLIGWF